MSDYENQEQLLRLMRYHNMLNGNLSSSSLDDYIKAMKVGQKKIYYISGADPERTMENPFMEPFKEGLRHPSIGRLQPDRRNGIPKHWHI